ncbi:transglycosylase domain-containing protein [Streptomyces xantholiticus]|uniref:Transglycosylase domain-containing protein n=1 Tax=Streptomyces xantholiticus TaxID=68285 RepID=A0ABV1V5V6_9ACTN
MSDEPQQQGWTPQDATAAGPSDKDKNESKAPETERGPESDAETEAGTDPDPDEEPAADNDPASGADAGKGPDDGRPDSERGSDGGEAPDAAVPSGDTAKTERSRRPRRKRTGWRRAVPTWRIALGTLLVASLLTIGGLVTGYLLVDIPPANAAATAQTNVYLYADGTHIARDGDINRENVSLDRIPLTVQHAVLAAEDRDFYSAPAIDPLAMIRAAWNTVTGKGKQSGSTITQQYVKNYYLGQEQTVTRKVKEFFIAIKLGRNQSKSQILEGYLNTSYFGRNAYGIQAAAHAYYGKDVEDLDVAEGAYLAGLLNAPNAYDVATHPEKQRAALARWNYVLGGMVKEKWLGATTREALAFPTPRQAKTSSGLSGQGGYIVQAVEDQLAAHGILDEKTLATGGYRITTTLQRPKQDALTAAVNDRVMSRLDSEREADRDVRVGGASIEPDTGKVVAMYGGIDYTRQYVNNATRRDYQVGSTFKPFVFASAIEHHSLTQEGRPIAPNAIYVGDSKRPVQGWNGPRYAPENEDHVSYGPIPVREAADNSVNAVFAQMAVDVGPARVMSTAIALGLPSTTPDLSPSPSIALGPATASVLDMAGAYASLANHGKHIAYTLIEKITKNGVEVALPEQRTVQAVGREAADTTTYVLRGVVAGGTGSAAQSAGRPAAGKTGTAEEDRAAWFAGYTPELSTVIAVMGQNPQTGAQTSLYGALGMSRINGGGPPAEIWGQYTAAALEGSLVRDFELQLAPGADDPPPDPRDPSNPNDPNDPGGSRDPEDIFRGRNPDEQSGQGRDSGPYGAGGGRPGTTPSPAAPGGAPGAAPGQPPGTGTSARPGAGPTAPPLPTAPAAPSTPATPFTSAAPSTPGTPSMAAAPSTHAAPVRPAGSAQ